MVGYLVGCFMTACSLSFVSGKFDSVGMPACGPVCMKYCPYDNVLDDKGCPTCRCKGKPTEEGLGKLTVPERPSCPTGTRPTRRNCDVTSAGYCGTNGVCVETARSIDGVCCIRRRIRRPNGPSFVTGICPSAMSLDGCEVRKHRTCENDADCRKRQKCCQDNCGKFCKKVRGSTKRLNRNQRNRKRSNNKG